MATFGPRRSDQEAAACPARPLGPDSLLDKFPELKSYLETPVHTDGSPRQTSTLTLFVEQGTCKLCLNDRDLEVTAWVSGRGLVDVLERLEGNLADGSVEWRVPSGRKTYPRR